MIQPLLLFSKWFKDELNLSNAKIPTAVCLSTIGIDNFPNARFVSFKELINDSFIITGTINSRKGIEIENNQNVSLTFWWTATERQIRIQGVASKISNQLADTYFNERSVNSQAVSSICHQGKEVDNLEQLKKKVTETALENNPINRPKNWSGFSIKPIRIECMQFNKSRFHDRKLYELVDNKWNFKQIEP